MAKQTQNTESSQVDRSKSHQVKQAAAATAKVAGSLTKGVLHATAEQSDIGRQMARAAKKMEQGSEKSKEDKQAYYEALHRELTNNLTVDDGNDPNNFRDNIMQADDKKKD